MPKIDVYNIEGKKVSNIELNEKVFGIKPNEKIVHIALVNYMANQRQGTANTKTRAEVSGGGRKPWKQKGTGRARAGSSRSPIWVKGGITFGPRPKEYRYRINRKERQLAIKSVLSEKVLSDKLVLLDKIEFTEIKTKNMTKVLDNLKIEDKVLIILEEKNEMIQKSARNLQNVKTIVTDSINIYDLLKYKKLILTTESVKKIEEVYA